VREQLVHRGSGVPGEPKTTDDGAGDDVPLVIRREGGDQEQQRDECRERLGGQDQGTVDALEFDERDCTATGERRLQPARELMGPVGCQRPAPLSPDTAAGEDAVDPAGRVLGRVTALVRS
jgi:hypothetical protein